MLTHYRCETTFGHCYMCYHTFSLYNKPAVYKSAVKLCLWREATGHWIAFHCLSPESRLETKKPGQVLPTHSALWLAGEHMPQNTDRWNI